MTSPLKEKEATLAPPAQPGREADVWLFTKLFQRPPVYALVGIDELGKQQVLEVPARQEVLDKMHLRYQRQDWWYRDTAGQLTLVPQYSTKPAAMIQTLIKHKLGLWPLGEEWGAGPNIGAAHNTVRAADPTWAMFQAVARIYQE